MAPGDPTVYVPTLEGGNRLAACLESLQRQTMVPEIVVADNGSGEGCRELLESKFPGVRRIAFGQNLGFGMALNRAIERFGEGPVILLNDDAVAESRFVEELMRLAAETEMVAAVLVSERDPDRIDSAGVMVDQTLMAFDYLTGEAASALEEASDPMGPTGGGALYDRDAFNEVGGFDENIFLYYEDVDLALRIRAAGGTCRLATEARATHGYSVTLGSRSGRKYAMTGWSRGYILRRYRIFHTPARAAGAVAREAAMCAGQLIRDHTLAGMRGRLRGWWQARALPPRPLPEGAITKMPVWRALALRKKRHAAS